ncbi:short transient receptor potential channel 3 isoform X2 [Strongylocentrotus purpuratus]|nr:short transient receptor potential channel 3 isoform X2 [Strongylocentrotus purpuratus]
MATGMTISRDQNEDGDVFINDEEGVLRAIGKKLFEAINEGDLIKVDVLLRGISANSSNLDIRDKDGTNTYSHAISKGFSPIVETLLQYNVPLGDALLRACAASYEDAMKIIIKHTKKLSNEERQAVIECRCDNDDFHEKMTPLKMAAIRNNFIIVQYLLKAGAERIREPKLEGLSEASLSEVVEYLDIYRALSSPAYLGLAHPNALSNAFKLTGRLRKIAGLWEAVNKEFYDLADQVEQFCASLLDYVANSVELGTLFRQSDDPEVVHVVAQVKNAVDFEQKAFVAHAYTQKIMSINFYRNIDTHTPWFGFLSLLTMFGYPFICLAYILVQHPRLKRWLSIPYIKLCIFFGSDLAIFVCYAALCVVNDPRITDIILVFILIFCVALSWKHICDIMEYGIGDFLGYGANILESITLIISFVLLMCKSITLLLDVYETRAMKRHDKRVAMVNNVTVTSDLKLSNVTVTDRLEQFVSLDWNDPQIVLYVLLGVVVLPNAIRAFTTALNSYQDLYSIWESTVGALSDMFKFVTVFAIFHFAFAVGLFGIYVTQKEIYAEDLADEGYHSIPNALLTLWWVFNSMGDKAELNGQVTFVNVVHIVIVGIYYTVALVLINTLIAILASKFESIAENSDTEWKFGRTKMWLRFIRTDIALPPPFNIVPTTGFIIRLLKNCFSLCTAGCTQTSQKQPEKSEEKTNHDGNARKVMKEILKRYNTTQIEKPDDEESFGIDDIRQINQDFVTVK